MNDIVETASSRAALRRYLQILRRQWWILVLATVLAAGAAVAYAESRTPVYAASMKIVVGQGQALFGADASGAFQPFTQTMTDLLESDIVARRAIRADGLSLTPNQLLDRLSVTTNPDTSVLQVTYDDTDVGRATRVLGTVGDVFGALVNRGTKVPLQRTAPSVQPQAQPVSASVFDPAHPLPGKVSPHVARTVVIAVILGLLGGLLLAFLRDALSGRVRTEEEAAEAFGAPVIGMLPPGTVGTTPSQVSLLPSKLGTRIAESLQLLTATLRFSGEQQEKGVILVTSARPEDGKTTVVAHISSVLARSGRSVIAAEADLRRPALHRFLGVESGLSGLTDVLNGDGQVEDTLIDIPLDVPIAATDGLNPVAAGLISRSADVRVSRRRPADDAGHLRLLCAGGRGASPTQLLSLGKSAELMASLRDGADYVVVDTPPILLSGDAFPLVQLADMVLVVCREGTTSRDEANALRKTLQGLGVRQFSVVLTESGEAQHRAYGYEYAD